MEQLCHVVGSSAGLPHHTKLAETWKVWGKNSLFLLNFYLFFLREGAYKAGTAIKKKMRLILLSTLQAKLDPECGRLLFCGSTHWDCVSFKNIFFCQFHLGGITHWVILYMGWHFWMLCSAWLKRKKHYLRLFHRVISRRLRVGQPITGEPVQKFIFYILWPHSQEAFFEWRPGKVSVVFFVFVFFLLEQSFKISLLIFFLFTRAWNQDRWRFQISVLYIVQCIYVLKWEY